MSRVAGVILSLIGGLISLLLGLFIYDLFPEFLFFGELFVSTFQICLILGGLISFAGVLLSYIRQKLAFIIILIGGLLGGGNILTLIGAGQIRNANYAILSQKIKARNYMVFWVSFLLFLIIGPLVITYFQGYKRTFQVDKDAYVSEQYPDTNYGAANSLRVGAAGGNYPFYTHNIYLHFTISSDYWREAWREAWICVNFYYGSTDVDIGVNLISNNWDEMNINWNNRPESTIYLGHLFYDGTSDRIRINSFQIINGEISVCLYPIWVDWGGILEGYSKEGASNNDQIAYIEINYMGYDLADIGMVLRTSIIILGVIGLAVLAFYVAVRLNLIRRKAIK
ncbi:MAG: DNRLRE domain-containing protein [Promethearchaeia archaeon]